MNAAVLGLFVDEQTAVACARDLHQQCLAVSMMTPYPIEGLAEMLGAGKSPMRKFALFGGMTGFATGFSLAVYASTAYIIPVGGRAIIALPPFLLISYELTILFGILSTLIGLLIIAKLPAWRERPYCPETGIDRFGVLIECEHADAERVQDLLRTAGAESIRREEELICED